MTTTRIDGVRAGGILMGALVMLTALDASALTRVVSNGTPRCPGATYTTIQAAVDAAAPHDKISVCAGTYAEQITIPAGKDGLVLRSKTPLAAIIQAPAKMADPGDIVRIAAARQVTLEGFTIAGPLPNALFCSPLPRTGVRVDGGGSAIIRGNRITDVRSEDVALRGCQNGFGILVGSEAEAEIGTAVIERNTIESYEKTGILVENVGSSARIVDNQVTGDGPITTVAQNGIQVSRGADAVVGNNWVAGQMYSPSPLSSALLFEYPGRLTILGNQVRDADYGIITIDATAPEMRDNWVAGCTANGIDLDEDAVGTAGAVVATNESHDNKQDGIYVSASSKGNTLRENKMFANGALDARDDSSGKGTAGTANQRVHNHCKTDDHFGLLCEP